MPAAITINSGDTFGRWTVIERAPNRNEKRFYVCRCSCEAQTIREVVQSALRNGYSKSCGCLTVDATSERNLTHGMTYTDTYRTWNAMKTRCNNPGVINYIDYGGRGIRVCDRWSESFEAFLEDMGEKPEGMSIERIDVNGNYEPSNCRWATKRDQMENRRITRTLTVNGTTKPVTAWARDAAITRKALLLRLKAGWTPEQAVGIEAPPNELITLTHGSRTLPLLEWSIITGSTPQIIYNRVERGWSVEQALGFAPPPERKPRPIELECQAKPGEQFFYWTVMEERPRVKGMRHWLCRCVCGREKVVQPHNIKRGASKSCGCMKGKLARASRASQDALL